jgi:hypothetical protein
MAAKPSLLSLRFFCGGCWFFVTENENSAGFAASFQTVAYSLTWVKKLLSQSRTKKFASSKEFVG